MCMIGLFSLFFHHFQSSFSVQLQNSATDVILPLDLALPPRSLENVATVDRRERLITGAQEWLKQKVIYQST